MSTIPEKTRKLRLILVGLQTDSQQLARGSLTELEQKEMADRMKQLAEIVEGLIEDSSE